MNQDKTYMWLIVIAFVALLTATAFAFMEMQEMQNENLGLQPKVE